MKNACLVSVKAAVAAAVLSVVSVAGAAVTLSDRVLTITESGVLSSILSGANAAYYTALRTDDGTITNVVLTGNSQITVTLTEDLEYTGAWNLAKAVVKLSSSSAPPPPIPPGRWARALALPPRFWSRRPQARRYMWRLAARTRPSPRPSTSLAPAARTFAR